MTDKTTPTRDEAVRAASLTFHRRRDEGADPWDAMADAVDAAFASAPAPAIGRVDADEVKRIRDWLLERNRDHLAAMHERTHIMSRKDGDAEMFLDAAILLCHLASLSPAATSGVDAGRVTLFSALEAAYIRGAAWCAEMGMTHTFAELRKAAYDYADKEEKDVICREVSAPLSPAATPGLAMPSREWMRDKIVADPDVEDCGAVPAATPVSEAGGEALASEGIAKIVYAAMKWAAERAENGKPPEWVDRGNSLAQAEARRFAVDIAALAKPASSPAGRDVDWKSLFETAHGALICIAEAQADAHYARKVADELTDAALSQSTSAGRG